MYIVCVCMYYIKTHFYCIGCCSNCISYTISITLLSACWVAWVLNTLWNLLIIILLVIVRFTNITISIGFHLSVLYVINVVTTSASCLDLLARPNTCPFVFTIIAGLSKETLCIETKFRPSFLTLWLIIRNWTTLFW